MDHEFCIKIPLSIEFVLFFKVPVSYVFGVGDDPANEVDGIPRSLTAPGLHQSSSTLA